MARSKKSGSSGEPPSDESPRANDKPVKRKTATAKSPQYADKLWQILDAKIGGREGLLAAAMCSTNPKAKDLIGHLLDPAYRTSGTKKLAARAGLGAPEIVDMFRDRKWLEATLALHEDLPAIIRGAVEDAKPSFHPCDECKGVKQEPPCWACRGKGEIRKAGDKDKLSLVTEAVGMTGKKSPFLNINQQIVGAVSQNTSFDELMRKAAVKVTKPKQIETIEAETAEE